MSRLDPYIGRTFNDRYKVVRFLYKSKFGPVFEGALIDEQPPASPQGIFKLFAKQPKPATGKSVAIKVFEQLGDQFYERLRRVYLPAVQLRHDHILSVLEVGKLDNDMPVVVSELVSGELMSDLSDAYPLQVAPAVRLAGQLVAAAKHANSCGILHGAIEPEAVLVHDPGGEESVKLMDFGWLKATEDDSEVSDKAPDCLGNPYFLSPELVLDQSVDERSDVYSIGCILYQMLSGKPPYYAQDSNPIEVLYRKATEDPIALRQLEPNPYVPYALGEVVMKAIQRNPADRYNSLEELQIGLMIAYKAYYDSMTVE